MGVGRAAFLAGIAACLAWGGLALPARGYDVVTRNTPVIQAKVVTVTGHRCRLLTDRGPVVLDDSDIDFYATFRRNLGKGGGNVVVFKTGSFLRFDSLTARAGGLLELTANGGSKFVIPEALVDFEASVLEAATVTLPAGASLGSAVTRSSDAPGSAWSDEEDGDVAMASAAYAPQGPRPAGGLIPFSPLGSMSGQPFPTTSPEASPAGTGSSPPFRATPFSPGGGDGSDGAQTDGPQDPGSTPSDRSRGDASRDQPAGRVMLAFSTEYAGPIAGLQLQVAYPPSCTPVPPVQFTGFASAMIHADNLQGSPLNIAGVMTDPANPAHGPGEFLDVVFNWTGRVPGVADFAIGGVLASDERGNNLPDFHVTAEVR